MAIPGNFLSPTAESIDPDTSGWSAVLNCAKSLGSGGRNGDGVLTITSTAAGEMQAATASTYPVASGTLYQAFADAASANQAERIGIQWLTDALVSVSTTWSPTTSAASASWHRIAVGGVAPVGATRARVVLSATASAASKTHFFENVFFGFPIRTSGNLVSFGVESIDVDTTGWAVDTNCTITRDVPVVTWPVDWYLSGGPVLKVTVTANGNAAVKATESPTVVPGTDYMGYVYLNPPSAASACWIELRWYDASASLIGTKRATLAAPGTGWYRQKVGGIAPAGAASVVLAAGITSGTAGQVVRLEGAVVAEATVIAAGSVVPYEDASFEAGVGQWTVGSGVATIARSTPWSSTGGHEGSYRLVVSSSTATASVLVSGRYPVTPGVGWRPQVDILAGASAWQAALGVRWYDASSTLISTDTSTADTIPGDGRWWRLYADAPSPAGAVTAAIELTLTAPTTSATCGIDAVALYEALPAFETVPHPDLGEITVVLRELGAGDALTLYRVVGTTQSLVRGPDGWISGYVLPDVQMTVEDYEAPIGTPVSYRYETVDLSTGGVVGQGASGTVSVTASDASSCWVKDPIAPYRNVLLRAATAPDWARPIEQTEYRIRGRRHSVILSDVRGGRTGTLEVWTDTDEQRRALHFALDTGNILLFQLPPGLGLEDAYYVVGQAVEPRVVAYGGEPLRRWQLPLTEVDAPIGGVGGSAGWTAQDLVATYATVGDVLAAYATVLDLALDNREV